MNLHGLRKLIKEEIQSILREANDPINWQAQHNRMSLKVASQDPNSRIAKVVNYLRKHGPATKADILANALGKKLAPRGASNRDDYEANLEGYASDLFAAAKKNGLLKPERKGNAVVWNVGPNSHIVPKQ